MKKVEDVLSKNYVLRHISSFMFTVIVMYGFYVQVHGDYSPGGGFQSGVIFATAVVLYAVLFGDDSVRSVLSGRAIGVVSAVGVLIYIIVGLSSMFLGEKFLSYLFSVFEPIDEQKIGIFVVELGVGLTVFGSFVSIYFDFSSWRNGDTLA